MTDFDSPWKEALDVFFEAFLQLFFPQAHADIDWSQRYRSLEQELEQIAVVSEMGERRVDKLFEVRLKSGVKQWVLIHVEIQMDDEGGFPVRMFVYHYRIFDKYNMREVVSLAVLGDDNPNWRPQCYNYERWGMELGFRFPVVKLFDYAVRRQELEASDNSFATVVLAHLDTQETKQAPNERKDRKFALTRRLLERGWDAQRVRQLYRVIDWLMELPGDLKIEYQDRITKYQEENRMPFIDTFEEIGIAKGMEMGIERGASQARLDDIETILQSKFPAAFDQLMSEIRQIRDVEKLKKIVLASATVTSPDMLRAFWVNGADR